MIGHPPFVVVISGPSSGVGKSTLACNLAVYLKGLVEDLPVALVSGDSVAIDAMFAFPGHRPRVLSDLQGDVAFSELLVLGEFGVEFCHAGAAVAGSPAWLRKKLAQADFDGVLILDLDKDHPLLTSALWAADLVLAPVKDPSALGDLVALRKQLLAGGGDKQHFWLLPSELGGEGRYLHTDQWSELLRFAADERDFQVLGETFVADFQVRELAAGQAKPVLTRAPQSQLHQQLQQLAELLLVQRQRQGSYATRVRRWQRDGTLPARSKRVGLFCPHCRQPVLAAELHYLEAFPSRQRLLLHRSCLKELLKGSGTEAFMATAELLLIQPAVAHGGLRGELRLQVLSSELELLNVELLPSVGWGQLLRRATGRQVAELYWERLLVSRQVSFAEALGAQWHQTFTTLRKRLREVCRAEKI